MSSPRTQRVRSAVLALPEKVQPFATALLQVWAVRETSIGPHMPPETYHPGDLPTWLGFHRSRETFLEAFMMSLAGNRPPIEEGVAGVLSWLEQQEVSLSGLWQSQAGFYFRHCVLPCLQDLSDPPWRLYRKATAEEADWDAMAQLLYLDPSAAADPVIAQRLHTCRYSADPEAAVQCGYKLARGGYRWLDDDKPEAAKTRKIRIGAALQLLAEYLKTGKRTKYAVTEPDVRRLWDAVAQDWEGQPHSDLPMERLSRRLKEERQALQEWLQREFEGADPGVGDLGRQFLLRR